MVVSYENALLYKTLKDHNETLEMEVEKRTEQLRVMASMDALTKTNNRYSMLNRLEDEVKLVQDEDHQAFSILLIDVDNFKKFNDTYGHDCGDFVLVSLASHLKALISEDDMLARWGGEEFIILLSNTEKEKAFKIAQRICNNISSEEYFYEAKRLCVTLTIGVSEYTKENKDVESVISNADKALYSGKKTGKNKAVLYHNELDEWE